MGLQINAEEMTLSLTRKTDSYNSTILGGLLLIKIFSVKFDKVNWLTFVIGSSNNITIDNITLSNGRKIQQEKSQIIIQIGASTKGWGAHFNGVSMGRKWWKKEQGQHINVLELMAVKFAILAFTKSPSNLTKFIPRWTTKLPHRIS